jgi:hypothetical protein
LISALQAGRDEEGGLQPVLAQGAEGAGPPPPSRQLWTYPVVAGGGGSTRSVAGGAGSLGIGSYSAEQQSDELAWRWRALGLANYDTGRQARQVQANYYSSPGSHAWLLHSTPGRSPYQH